MPTYNLLALDPDGTVAGPIPWFTPFLPRIGDEVMLPDGYGLQEMSVEGVQHGIDSSITVELGGSDGWERGSVHVLFKTASAWRKAAFAKDKALSALWDSYPSDAG